MADRKPKLAPKTSRKTLYIMIALFVALALGGIIASVGMSP